MLKIALLLGFIRQSSNANDFFNSWKDCEGEAEPVFTYQGNTYFTSPHFEESCLFSGTNKRFYCRDTWGAVAAALTDDVLDFMDGLSPEHVLLDSAPDTCFWTDGEIRPGNTIRWAEARTSQPMSNKVANPELDGDVSFVCVSVCPGEFNIWGNFHLVLKKCTESHPVLCKGNIPQNKETAKMERTVPSSSIRPPTTEKEDFPSQRYSVQTVFSRRDTGVQIHGDAIFTQIALVVLSCSRICSRDPECKAFNYSDVDRICRGFSLKDEIIAIESTKDWEFWSRMQ